jgi:Ca-activated chloride channel family protein
MLELLQNFHFIRPLGLLLIPIGTLIWWTWNRHQDPLRGWRVQMDPVLLEALVVGGQPSGQARGLATLVGWLIAALAIAGPTWQLEPSPFVEDAPPLLVLLKADLSGQVPTLSPTTMERARLKIADLAEARQGQALGLIAYAGSAHLVLPPTKDTQAVALMAAEIGPEVMPVRGDRLDLALAEAQRMLDNSDQVGSIVVLADTIGCDQKLLDQWRKANPTAVQILAIQSPSAEVDASVRAAGQRLKAPVEVWDPVGNDVAAIVRRGSNVARFQRGEQGGQWQEAGWWLVPLVGLAMLVRFRLDARGAGA